jgi:hypothetical protein
VALADAMLYPTAKELRAFDDLTAPLTAYQRAIRDRSASDLSAEATASK